MLLSYRDLKDDALVELDGLPLIPLADGKLGRFAFTTTNGTDAHSEGELNTSPLMCLLLASPRSRVIGRVFAI